MNLVEARDLAIERDEHGRLSLRRGTEQPIVDVAFVQLFPHTDPMRYVSAQVKQGGESVEIVIVKDLLDLPPQARQWVLDDIRRRNFLPQIREIRSIQSSRGVDTWNVETDRGRTTFVVEDRGENVVSMERGMVLVTDKDKRRYKIPDIAMLSPKSKSILEHVLM